MATKKKTSGKTKKKTSGKKTKRKKTPAMKPMTRRKIKAAKKGPAKKASRASRKKATPLAKVAVKRKPASPPARTAETPMPPGQAAPPEERIGVVTHYYGHVSVATVRLESGTLRVGDVIHISGHTTDFSQRVESLEINHAPANEVRPGDDFGLKVTEHAREHDVVYKVSPGEGR
jgi:translation elongation factor EF-Tu-like GTPase